MTQALLVTVPLNVTVHVSVPGPVKELEAQVNAVSLTAANEV